MKRVFVTKKQIDCVKVRVECRDVFCQELLALDLLFLLLVKGGEKKTEMFKADVFSVLYFYRASE